MNLSIPRKTLKILLLVATCWLCYIILLESIMPIRANIKYENAHLTEHPKPETNNLDLKDQFFARYCDKMR
jgi:hypothetical protein